MLGAETTHLVDEVCAVLCAYPQLALRFDRDWVRDKVAATSNVWRLHPLILLTLDAGRHAGLRWREASLQTLASAGVCPTASQFRNLRGDGLPQWHSFSSELRIAAWVTKLGFRIVNIDEAGCADLEVEIEGNMARLDIKTPTADTDQLLTASVIDAIEFGLSSRLSGFHTAWRGTFDLQWGRRSQCDLDPNAVSAFAQDALETVHAAIALRRPPAHVDVGGCAGAPKLRVTLAPDALTDGVGYRRGHVEMVGGLTQAIAVGDFSRYLRRKVACQQWGKQLGGAKGLRVLVVDQTSTGPISHPLHGIHRPAESRLPDAVADCCPELEEQVDLLVCCLFRPDEACRPSSVVYWAGQVSLQYPLAVSLLTAVA